MAQAFQPSAVYFTYSRVFGRIVGLQKPMSISPPGVATKQASRRDARRLARGGRPRRLQPLTPGQRQKMIRIPKGCGRFLFLLFRLCERSHPFGMRTQSKVKGIRLSSLCDVWPHVRSSVNRMILCRPLFTSALHRRESPMPFTLRIGMCCLGFSNPFDGITDTPEPRRTAGRDLPAPGGAQRSPGLRTKTRKAPPNGGA